MATLVLIWGALSFAFGAPAQTRILNHTRDAPTPRRQASSPRPSTSPSPFGAWLGGALIETATSYAVLPWVGVVGSLLAVSVSVLSWRRERGRVAGAGVRRGSLHRGHSREAGISVGVSAARISETEIPACAG